MSIEQSTVSDLIKLLREARKTDEQIVEVLESIIKSYLMYGGNIQDVINFQIDKTKKEILRLDTSY